MHKGELASLSANKITRGGLPWMVDPNYVSDGSSIILLLCLSFPSQVFNVLTFCKPKPLGNYCVFNYDRPVWQSLNGKDVVDKFREQFARSLNLEFRRKMTGEELKKLHDKFRKAGKLALYKTKRASVKNTRSAKLFLAVGLPCNNPASCSNGLTLSQSSAPDGGKIDTVNDQSTVIRLLQIPELAHRVLSFISPSIGDITALAMVCKRATACIRASHVSLVFIAFRLLSRRRCL